MDQPGFRYHPHPERSAVVDSSERPCPRCGVDRGISYVGPFYATEEVEGLCLQCIADGSAARRWDGEFIERFVAEDEQTPVDPAKLDELIHRTPGPQPGFVHTWPVHCGDYCALLGRVTWSDVEPLARELDGDLRSIEEESGMSRAELQAELASDSSALWAHLFECLTCRAHRLLAEYE